MAMFGYASDVLARVDWSEERHAQFAEFCDGAVEAIAWTTPAFSEDGEVINECVDGSTHWQFDFDDIQDVVLTANIEEWMAFFTECFDAMQAARRDSFVQHGHDYVLTACGHGAGFWDRGYPKVLSDELCDMAEGGTSAHSFWFEDDDSREVLRYEQG